MKENIINNKNKFFKLSFSFLLRSARVAQLVERQAFNLNVQGSSPCSGELVLLFLFYYCGTIIAVCGNASLGTD